MWNLMKSCTFNQRPFNQPVRKVKRSSPLEIAVLSSFPKVDVRVEGVGALGV